MTTCRLCQAACRQAGEPYRCHRTRAERGPAERRTRCLSYRSTDVRLCEAAGGSPGRCGRAGAGTGPVRCGLTRPNVTGLQAARSSLSARMYSPDTVDSRRPMVATPNPPLLQVADSALDVAAGRLEQPHTAGRQPGAPSRLAAGSAVPACTVTTPAADRASSRAGAARRRSR